MNGALPERLLSATSGAGKVSIFKETLAACLSKQPRNSQQQAELEQLFSYMTSGDGQAISGKTLPLLPPGARLEYTKYLSLRFREDVLLWSEGKPFSFYNTTSVKAVNDYFKHKMATQDMYLATMEWASILLKVVVFKFCNATANTTDDVKACYDIGQLLGLILTMERDALSREFSGVTMECVERIIASLPLLLEMDARVLGDTISTCYMLGASMIQHAVPSSHDHWAAVLGYKDKGNEVSLPVVVTQLVKERGTRKRLLLLKGILLWTPGRILLERGHEESLDTLADALVTELMRANENYGDVLQCLIAWLKVMKRSMSLIPETCVQRTKDQLGELLNILFALWGDNDASIRRAVFESIKICIKLGEELPGGYPVMDIAIKAAMEMQWHQRAKGIILEHVVTNCGHQYLQDNAPQYLNHLFVSVADSHCRISAEGCFRAILNSYKSHGKKKNSVSIESQQWYLDMVATTKKSSAGIQHSIGKHLFPIVLEVFPSAFSMFVETLSSGPALGMLHMLRAGRMAKLVSPEVFLAEGSDHENLILSSLSHYDQRTRNTALEVVCVAPKAAAGITPLEVRAVCVFIRIVLQESAQVLLNSDISILNKFFKRVCESICNGEPKSGPSGAANAMRTELPHLVELCVQSFSVGASTEKQLAAATVLSLLHSVQVSIVPSVPLLDSSRILSMIEYGLPSENERVRQLTYDILIQSFDGCPISSTVAEVQSLLIKGEYLESLLTESKSEGGSLLLRLIARSLVMNDDISVTSQAGTLVASHRLPGVSNDRVHFEFLRGCLDRIDHAVHHSSGALRESCMKGFVSGMLKSANYCLEDWHWPTSSTIPADQVAAYVGRLWDLCLQIADVSLSLLSHAATSKPWKESMSTSAATSLWKMTIDYERLSLIHGQKLYETKHFTSASGPSLHDISSPAHNYITLSLWRSFRESCFCLSRMVERFLMSRDGSDLITRTMLQRCGNMLMRCMLSVLHRGTLEGAAYAMKSISKVLLSSSDPHIHKIPLCWYENLVEALEHSDFAVFRKSGGIPAAFLALFEAESALGSRNLIQQAFHILIEKATSVVSEVSETECDILKCFGGVHALNVLERIISDAPIQHLHTSWPLVELLVPVIQGSGCRAWPVRSACMKLFTALTNKLARIRNLSDQSSEVGMTSTEFFSRYRQVYAYVRECMVRFSPKGSVEQRLFPVLELLTKLSPPARYGTLEGEDDTRACLMMMSGAREYVVRVMSARALLAITPVRERHHLLSEIAHSIPLEPKLLGEVGGQNGLHGRLMILCHGLAQEYGMSCLTSDQVGLAQVPELCKDVVVEASAILNSLLLKLWVVSLVENPCHITRALMFRIVSALSIALCPVAGLVSDDMAVKWKTSIDGLDVQYDRFSTQRGQLNTLTAHVVCSNVSLRSSLGLELRANDLRFLLDSLFQKSPEQKQEAVASLEHIITRGRTASVTLSMKSLILKNMSDSIQGDDDLPSVLKKMDTLARLFSTCDPVQEWIPLILGHGHFSLDSRPRVAQAYMRLLNAIVKRTTVLNEIPGTLERAWVRTFQRLCDDLGQPFSRECAVDCLLESGWRCSFEPNPTMQFHMWSGVMVLLVDPEEKVALIACRAAEIITNQELKTARAMARKALDMMSQRFRSHPGYFNTLSSILVALLQQ